ncbi:hypothetical protein RSOLAG22IIIB_00216 [Rhizoctonia solani]|uniref:Matrin-type domain-containing protein n=1 Tax=Rhizoctonia solani TaxID=456999 RepID=A0A0K6FKS6_9AGAM|nr:hypothetical protein RSOLAG22IIIB_00216 [Rhizoctonia solani]
MSEFWVSKKRYWCKYCGISIADDAPSRQHHENGLRHKGNVERYIRDIYKTSEKKKKDAAEEEREMKRIDAAAREAYAKDISSGAAAASTSASSSSTAPAPRPAAATKPPPPKSTDKFANYSTAESLGFVDEAALEAQRRQTEGVAGEWQLVLPTAPAPKPKSAEEGEKRGLQPAQTEEKAAAESSRNFRVGERKVGAGLQDIWEPDIPIRIKVKTETQPAGSEQPEVKPKTEIDYGLPQATEKPVWKPTAWSKAGEVKQEVQEESTEGIKTEEPTAEAPLTDAVPPPQPTPPPEPPVKNEPEEPKLDEIAPPSGGGLFRKRKAPPTTAGTRGVKKR